MADLPCDADGRCMVCKVVPLDENVLLCSSCTSPWHMQCLRPILTSVPVGDWDCPDCAIPSSLAPSSLRAVPGVQSLHSNAAGLENDMVSKIRAIQADNSLSDAEKARKRQELMAHQGGPSQGGGMEAGGGTNSKSRDPRNETLELLDENLNCIFCMQLAERPVTTPCGHNFCLKCFEKWIGKGKKSCGKCRAAIPAQMAHQPRINSALVMAIRLARAAAGHSVSHGLSKPYIYIDNEKRPEKCFTSERAVKTGKANACSGRIFVTIAPDHFGPILPKDDPQRGQGVLVGESWEDRMECRQWGAHFPHVAGIAGQSDYGAQSVALSGGYEDDEDHGEWFLYTGSGGRDLTGNKRTNKEQSFDQKFVKSNEALRVSCKRGYPVRVVRSHKEKRSSYAPESGVRYDGIYRIEKCWRKKGIQGHKVCRYLFVRCDNEPAPWTSDVLGDRRRPLPAIGELGDATDIFERRREPAWDWQEEKELWGWTADPPESRKSGVAGKGEKSTKRRQLNIQQKLLNEFGCSLCRKVMELPLSTPCGHNFCKPCLVEVFAGQQDMRERTGVGGRSLRVQKVMKRCPTCKGDITDFISRPQVNRQMEGLIQSLKGGIAEDEEPDGGEEQRVGGKGKSLDGNGYKVEVEEAVKDTDDESDDPALSPGKKFSTSVTKEPLSALSSANFAALLASDREECSAPKSENRTTATTASTIVSPEALGRRKRNKELTTVSSEVTADFEDRIKSRRLEQKKLRSSEAERQEHVVHEIVSDSEDESGHKGGKAREISEDTSSRVSTPSRRLTRSQNAAAVGSFKPSRKSFEGSPEIIEL